MPKVWEQYFPNLGNWECKSPTTRTYNCFAFAADDETRRWEANPPFQYYWPRNIPRRYDLPTMVMAFGTVGYTKCDDGNLEEGYEKIVLYIDPMSAAVSHAAKQIEDGRWKSKMGDEEDIIHETPGSLKSNSDGYGNPIQFMKRKKVEKP